MDRITDNPPGLVDASRDDGGWAGTQLAALADPTRRTVFEMLGESPSAVGDLAGRLPVSRPAVSQHLRVLADARLVRAEVDGARRIYSVDPAGLAELRRWVETRWDVVLDRFEKAAQREAARRGAEQAKTPQRDTGPEGSPAEEMEG